MSLTPARWEVDPDDVSAEIHTLGSSTIQFEGKILPLSIMKSEAVLIRIDQIYGRVEFLFDNETRSVVIDAESFAVEIDGVSRSLPSGDDGFGNNRLSFAEIFINPEYLSVQVYESSDTEGTAKASGNPARYNHVESSTGITNFNGRFKVDGSNASQTSGGHPLVFLDGVTILDAKFIPGDYYTPDQLCELPRCINASQNYEWELIGPGAGPTVTWDDVVGTITDSVSSLSVTSEVPSGKVYRRCHYRWLLSYSIEYDASRPVGGNPNCGHNSFVYEEAIASLTVFANDVQSGFSFSVASVTRREPDVNPFTTQGNTVCEPIWESDMSAITTEPFTVDWSAP